MHIEKILERMIAFASLFLLTGSDRHYEKVQDSIAEVLKLADKPSTDEIKIVKYKNGKPSVIDWNGERWVFDPGTTFRGGAPRR